jgi:hypothetical protein
LKICRAKLPGALIMITEIAKDKVRALATAVAARANEQTEYPPALWDDMAAQGLVSRVKSEDERSWFELTDDGCAALRVAGGRSYDTGECFDCGQSYAYPADEEWFQTACPMCGFYAGDE